MANISYGGCCGANIVHSGGASHSSSTITYDYTYNSTDTTITLTTSNLNKFLFIENASDVAVTLPSVSALNVGSWIKVFKMGAGDVTINRADSDMIEDGTSIANTEAAETWSSIELVLGPNATLWKIKDMLGTWVTS